MKIEIKSENGMYVVADEFEFIKQTFKTYAEAEIYFKDKTKNATIHRAIFYVNRVE